MFFLGIALNVVLNMITFESVLGLNITKYLKKIALGIECHHLWLDNESKFFDVEKNVIRIDF